MSCSEHVANVQIYFTPSKFFNKKKLRRTVIFLSAKANQQEKKQRKANRNIKNAPQPSKKSSVQK